MKLTIRLFAALRERAGAEHLVLEDLPEPLDIAGLKRVLAERHAELGSLEHVRGVVGTSYVDDDTVLDEDLEVSFLPPVSGGAPGAEPGDPETDSLQAGVFEVCADPLDPEEARRRVSHASCGATVVFTGTTRETNRGEDVARLDYEAYEEMARTEMAAIFARCNAQHGPGSSADDPELRLRMLCLHRTGTVAVGDPSVVVAVASPHRDAAFLAARFLIDELKQTVPFWKKEHYADGHHWIGDRS